MQSSAPRCAQRFSNACSSPFSSRVTTTGISPTKVRLEIARLRQLGLEAEEIPRRAAEDPLLLAPVDVLVLVDPVRNARDAFGGPCAGFSRESMTLILLKPTPGHAHSRRRESRARSEPPLEYMQEIRLSAAEAGDASIADVPRRWPLPAARWPRSIPSARSAIIVPFPAGGTADIMPRIFGEKLAAKWGQPVVVDNRPGAAGNIGAELVYKARARRLHAAFRAAAAARHQSEPVSEARPSIRRGSSR